MIDIAELRINNLVKIKTSNDAAFYPIYAIDAINSKAILGGVRECEGCKDINLLKPIPLSEELLLKCGFNKIKDGAWSGSDEKSYDKYEGYLNLAFIDGEYRIWDECEDNWYSHTMFKPIRYLHQLQNFIYHLRGEELDFILGY